MKRVSVKLTRSIQGAVVKYINFRSKNTPYVIVLLGIFFVSRFLYDRIGITFLGSTYQHYWQFIHQSLLETDMWRSIFYLHSQPPIFNTLTGTVLHLFPSNIQEAFHVLYYLAGALLAVSIYFLGVDIGIPNWLSMVLAMVFMISPSTISYEHWLMYGYLIASVLAFSGVALFRFFKTQKTYWGILFFSTLAFAALSWTIFHILWVSFIFIATLYLFQDRKKVLMAALLPLLLVFGWYTKNHVVFGEFAAGTWGGMNLSKITTFRLPEKQRKQVIRSGELSQFAAYPPFRNPIVYLKLLPDTPVMGIPVLDIAEFPDGSLNYHHRVYIDASKHYLQDALYTIRIKPALYLRAVVQSSYIFFHSSSDFELIREIRSPIQTFDLWWNRLFYGQWLNDEPPTGRVNEISLLHIGWWIVVAFIVGIAGSIKFIWKRPDKLLDPDGILVSFMLLNVLFVTVVGNTMELGENNRFRYVVDAFILLLFIRVLYVFFYGQRIKLVDKNRSES